MENTAASWKVASIAAGITCLLYSSGFLVFFTPFPLLFVSIMYGRVVSRRTILLSVVVAVVLYAIVLPAMVGLSEKWSLAKMIFILPGAGLTEMFNLKSAFIFGLVYFLYFMIFGFLFSEGVEKKWPIVKWGAVPIGMSLAFVLVVFVVLTLAGVNVIGELLNYMKTVLNEVVAIQEQNGTPSDKIFLIKQNTEQIASFSVSVIPAVLFLVGLLIVAMNQFLARFMVRIPGRFSHFGDVYMLSAPQFLVWFVIAFGFAFFAEKYLVHSDALRIVALNGLIAAAGLYLIQGFLVIAYYLREFKLRWMKTLTYVLIFMFFQAVAPVLILTGFVDLWVDFRKKVRKKDINKQNKE